MKRWGLHRRSTGTALFAVMLEEGLTPTMEWPVRGWHVPPDWPENYEWVETPPSQPLLSASPDEVSG